MYLITQLVHNQPSKLAAVQRLALVGVVLAKYLVKIFLPRVLTQRPQRLLQLAFRHKAVPIAVEQLCTRGFGGYESRIRIRNRVIQRRAAIIRNRKNAPTLDVLTMETLIYISFPTTFQREWCATFA